MDEISIWSISFKVWRIVSIQQSLQSSFSNLIWMQSSSSQSEAHYFAHNGIPYPTCLLTVWKLLRILMLVGYLWISDKCMTQACFLWPATVYPRLLVVGCFLYFLKCTSSPLPHQVQNPKCHQTPYTLLPSPTALKNNHQVGGGRLCVCDFFLA